MNRVFLCGRLGQDPEVKTVTGGNTVARLSLATSKSFVKDGQRQEAVTWHKIVVWGKQAENCQKYLVKGSKVLVEGEIQNRSWEKEGQKQYVTEIVANSVQFLSDKNAVQNSQEQPADSADEFPF